VDPKVLRLWWFKDFEKDWEEEAGITKPKSGVAARTRSSKDSGKGTSGDAAEVVNDKGADKTKKAQVETVTDKAKGETAKKDTGKDKAKGKGKDEGKGGSRTQTDVTAD
jgi:hypothetical protein